MNQNTMRYRYTIELLAYDGRIITRTYDADRVDVEGGALIFSSDAGDRWATLAIYPVNKTIVAKIEKLK